MVKTYNVPLKRSNKGGTQRIINAAIQYLEGTEQTYWDFGGTEGEVAEDSSFNVIIHGNHAFKMVKENDAIKEIEVYSSSNGDLDGNILGIVRERMNGLFSFLEEVKLIKQSIRVFIQKDDGITYLSVDDRRVVFNENYCKSIHITPGKPDGDLQIASAD